MVDAADRSVVWSLRRVRLARRIAIDALDVGTGVTAVLGPSGSGKTSLLNLLVGFETPDRGDVDRVHATASAGLPLYWAPQDGGLWPHLSACKHLEAVLPRGERDTAIAWLERFDLAPRADARPADLSAGECDRLAVARALASGAASLVLDEPFARVERTRLARDWSVIRAHRPPAALVFATHEPRHVLTEAERVICLGDGAVLFDGDVDTLYHRPPTEALATALGEGNWFSPREAVRWIGVSGGDGPGGAVFLRPESIAVEPDPGGGAVVEAARFEGVVERTTLRRLEDGESRVVYRRPGPTRLGVGERVRVRALLCCALFVLGAALAGCGDRDAVVAPSAVRAFKLPADGATQPAPRSVAVAADGSSCALDTAGRVLCYTPTGSLATWWRMPATEAGRPEGVCPVGGGGWAVCDTHYHRVLVFGRDGAVRCSFGTQGVAPGEFRYPVGITADTNGHLFVCEYGGNDRVQEFTADGQFVRAFGAFGTGPEALQRPSDLAIIEDRIYVADAINNRVQVYSTEGGWEGVLGGDAPPALDLPYGIAADAQRTLWVVEYGAGRVTRLDRRGRVLERLRTGAGHDRGLRTPWGIAVGEGGRILVADTGNRRMVELTR